MLHHKEKDDHRSMPGPIRNSDAEQRPTQRVRTRYITAWMFPGGAVERRSFTERLAAARDVNKLPSPGGPTVV